MRSPTDISLAQLVPNDEPGEPSSSNNNGEPSNSGHASGSRGQHGAGGAHAHSVGLGLSAEAMNRPPPEYTSPESSVVGGDESRRNSSESENTPLIHVLNRSRGASAAARSDRSPPIPSYNDAVRDGAGRSRSNSARPSR